jgi:hypothetical protein
VEVLMNGKTVQYNMDFRKAYPTTFKILNDENHVIYYIENSEEDDLIVFISPELKLIETIPMSEFENYLRKLNKKLFFNIISLFSDTFDTEEGKDITECILVNKETFVKPFTTNYRFQRINVITLNHQFLFYISPTQELGKIYDIEAIKRKEALLKKIREICPNENSKLFYNVPTRELLIINSQTGEITKIEPMSIGFYKEDLIELDKIMDSWKKIKFCDAREFLRLCEDKARPVKECNLFIQKNILYICIIRNHDKFNTLADVSRYLYNNPPTEIRNKISGKLGTDDILYLSNGDRKDGLIYKTSNGFKYMCLEDLEMQETCSDILSIFQAEDIVDIEKFNVPYILFIKPGDEKDAPPTAVETSKHSIWSDFFSKTLYISNKQINLKNIKNT